MPDPFDDPRRKRPLSDDEIDQALLGLGKEPEWRQRGYRSYAAFVAAVGDAAALASRAKDAEILQSLAAAAASNVSAQAALARVGIDAQSLVQQAQLTRERIAEDARQFNERLGIDREQLGISRERLGLEREQVGLGRERFGEDRRQFDVRQGFDQAVQNWREAVEADNFRAAQFWRARAQELQQNRLTLDYTQLLGNLRRGPQDYVRYWYISRGMTPPAGEESIALEEAIPPWARAVQPGTFSSGLAATPTSATTGTAPTTAAPAATRPNGLPAWWFGATVPQGASTSPDIRGFTGQVAREQPSTFSRPLSYADLTGAKIGEANTREQAFLAELARRGVLPNWART